LTTKLLHLSDLHFGPRLRQYLPEVVICQAHDLSPDLVVISGDLTQRARKHQFLQARDFLNKLPSPLLVIPGNHDVPLYNLFLRFLRPLERYGTYIAAEPDVAMVNEAETLSVVGLNSTRALTIDGGGLYDEQLTWAQAQFAQAPKGACRVVAVHHHFLPDSGHQRPIRRARYLLRRFNDMGVEIVLVGHRHWARAERATEGPVVVQAGTATSRRGKERDKGKNSFNVIEIDRSAFWVTCYIYKVDWDRFEPVWTEQFQRSQRESSHRKQRPQQIGAPIS
jgi:3',5'-cyclic AMP phosphodiesterase CpdA